VICARDSFNEARGVAVAVCEDRRVSRRPQQVRVGGDSEGRKKSPEDVKAFLKKVFALTP